MTGNGLNFTKTVSRSLKEAELLAAENYDGLAVFSIQ